MRANYKNTKIGEKIKFTKTTQFFHWFTNIIENGQTLTLNKIYTVKKISVASSWTAVTLEETEDLEYELGWFEKI